MNVKPLLIAAVSSISLLWAPLAFADSQYNATFRFPQFPPSLADFCPGETRNVSVTVENLGSVTWTTAQFHISYHWVQGATDVVFEGVRTVLPFDVASGAFVKLSAKVIAPKAQGTYTLRFDMVDEGVTWFSWKGSATGDVNNVNVLSAVTCLGFSRNVLPFVPHIDSCLPGTTPGSFITCGGSDFGDPAPAQPPTIVMKGLSSGDINLTTGAKTLTWDNKGFFVTVPENLSGFRVQKVRIQITNQLGRSSNEYSIDIRPILDLQLVPGTLLTVQSSDSSCTCSLSSPGSDITAKASHSGNVFGDNGLDTYKGTLGNDWVFDSAFYDTSGCNGLTSYLYGGGNDISLGAVPTVSLVVKWSYDNGFTSACYNLDLYARGPRGVPLK